MNQIHRIYEVEAKDIDTAKMKAVAKAFQEFDSRHHEAYAVDVKPLGNRRYRLTVAVWDCR